MLRLSLAVGALALTLAGCSAAPAGGGRSQDVTTAQPTAAASAAATVGNPMPVDPNITPISRSKPGADASAALELCGWRIDQVAAMGLVPSARDVFKYTPLRANDPERQTDHPAWLVEFAGDWTYRGMVAHQPTCAVIDGVPFVYINHGAQRANGTSRPTQPEQPPTLSLPSLAP